MLRIATLLLALSAGPLAACERAVCQVDPSRLDLARVLTFEDQPSGLGPGARIDEVMILEGAIIGERFTGQLAASNGTFDVIHGRALAPLTVVAGELGQNLSVTRLYDTNVLNGDGPAGYPSTEATGEGAIAVQFEADQSAIAFDIRGGEGGTARIQFLRRDGSVIDTLVLTPLAELRYGFLRQNDKPDIAGMLIESMDPQGQALDNLAFDHQPFVTLLSVPAAANG